MKKLICLMLIVVASGAHAINSIGTRKSESQLCFRDTEIYDKLARELMEPARVTGKSIDGQITSIWVSDSGNYTILKTTPGSNVACVVDIGAEFSPVGRQK